ncbi:unnamed protein product [Callosobruchus maculatus]|uniref:Uncharacterized protein n=1 Tax=Callosobruchus maculatus TaxID=64391 RepID=A0A653C7U3_CALMS|nr:unnamed protein product [Callosobruchus maculatus]VEN60615.1 unnamed protein product [Callosobruchus maculatus]
MDLEAINATAVGKPRLPLSQLPINKKHRIVSLQIIEGRYGECPLAELDEHVVFLPGRAAEVILGNLEQFTPGEYALVYLGSKATANGHHMQQFNIVKYN